MLERIGVSKRLAGLGIHASQFSIRDGDRELLPVRFDRLPTEYPYTLMVPQNVTKQVLLERLEELGGKVHRPYATGVSQTAEGTEVRLDSGDTIKAQYVVAADGMNSTIRGLAGLGHNGNGTLPLSFALADVRVEGGLPADQVLLFFSTPGMLVVAPLPDGSFRLVAEVDDAPEQPDVAYAQRLLDTRGPCRTTVRVTDVIWGSRFRIHERVADRPAGGSPAAQRRAPPPRTRAGLPPQPGRATLRHRPPLRSTVQPSLPYSQRAEPPRPGRFDSCAAPLLRDSGRLRLSLLLLREGRERPAAVDGLSRPGRLHEEGEWREVMLDPVRR
jgi:hypothetical protein